MAFNPDTMLEMLYQMHLQQTCSPKPPFWQEINIKDIKIPNNTTKLNEIQTKAFESFLKLPEGNLKGSVHLHPDVWFNLFINIVGQLLTNCPKDKLEEQGYNVNIPNGCCVSEKCPICVYNLEILKLLKTETNKEPNTTKTTE
jgi:hypothetical protein